MPDISLIGSADPHPAPAVTNRSLSLSAPHWIAVFVAAMCMHRTAGPLLSALPLSGSAHLLRLQTHSEFTKDTSPHKLTCVCAPSSLSLCAALSVTAPARSPAPAPARWSLSCLSAPRSPGHGSATTAVGIDIIGRCCSLHATAGLSLSHGSAQHRTRTLSMHALCIALCSMLSLLVTVCMAWFVGSCSIHTDRSYRHAPVDRMCRPLPDRSLRRIGTYTGLGLTPSSTNVCHSPVVPSDALLTPPHRSC